MAVNLLNIARPRPKGKPVERLHRTLLFVQAGVGRLLFFLGQQLRDRKGKA